ncbi:carbohydrate ABC transporter permease [Paenibacillus sp.]|uniref:carbohydrate ABC transporter permease n=1 Tax=Paenibacillus sp. TaxID=58172 RepID=UPI002D50AD20|nr:carbohydrate ABC transporter permease [Paenibacillus sp.]HZG58753.1 carbohydrate ABC transporter permease [Paenibacillus sp.]
MLTRFNWRHLPLLAVSAFALIPILLLAVNSFKPKSEIIINPMGLPSSWTIENYLNAWERGNYNIAYLNTIVITGFTVTLVCALSGLAAYGLTHLRTRGSALFIGYLFVSMSMPIGFIPIFFILVQLNLINTWWGVIIPYVGSGFAFNVFLMRAFMLGIPRDLLESAHIDGCGSFRSFVSIVLPLAKPAFTVAAIFCTLSTWNEFFLSNAILQMEEVRTVSVSYLNFTSKYGTNWGLMAAGGVITVVPMVVLFLLMTRKFVTGLQEGSVKF